MRLAQFTFRATLLSVLVAASAAAQSMVTKTMPEEGRATVRAYLDGKIQQWYAREDGRGVVFILNATSVAEAKSIMEALPLAKAGYVDLTYTGLAPLTPLRRLLDSAR